MDYSNFIVLLARQRSGTHALRSALQSHPDLFGVEEIFHLKSAEEPGTGDTNFFTFLKRQVGNNILRLIPVDYETLFLEYLEYLRGFTARRFLLLDVKYNTVHHIAKSYQPLVGPPYLFQLMVKHGLRTFVLTRRNYLRAFISMAKTRAGNPFHATLADEKLRDGKIRVNVHELLYELKRWQHEDEAVQHAFRDYPAYRNCDYKDRLFVTDYAEAIRPSGNRLAPEFLERFSRWLGIPNTFVPQIQFQKLSHLPLAETIENYSEVAAVLRGTAFEYCLKDEPMYRRPSRRPTANVFPAVAKLFSTLSSKRRSVGT
jgi:hypothetical protein